MVIIMTADNTPITSTGTNTAAMIIPVISMSVEQKK